MVEFAAGVVVGMIAMTLIFTFMKIREESDAVEEARRQEAARKNKVEVERLPDGSTIERLDNGALRWSANGPGRPIAGLRDDF